MIQPAGRRSLGQWLLRSSSSAGSAAPHPRAAYVVARSPQTAALMSSIDRSLLVAPPVISKRLLLVCGCGHPSAGAPPARPLPPSKLTRLVTPWGWFHRRTRAHRSPAGREP